MLDKRPPSAKPALSAHQRVRVGRHLAVIARQNRPFVVIDGLRVLTNVARGVDPARQFSEFPALDRFQGADADLRRFGDLF